MMNWSIKKSYLRKKEKMEVIELNRKKIEDFDGSMSFLLAQMNVSLHAIKVITNFLPKEHKDITREHSETLIEAVELAKGKIEKFINMFEQNRVISQTDFEFFIPYLLNKIREYRGLIDDCEGPLFMPYHAQNKFKERNQKKLNKLLKLANRCEIKIE